MAWVAAPEPRPPQPTRPSLIVSLPKACAPRATCTWLAAIAEPATSSEELRKNVRRELATAGVAGEGFMRRNLRWVVQQERSGLRMPYTELRVITLTWQVSTLTWQVS